MVSGLRFDTGTQTFLPDISEITLLCEEKRVGQCAIDFANYIDVTPKIEKAVIGSSRSATDASLGHKVLIGDSKAYPGAFVTFKIKVEPTFELQTPSSSLRYH